MNGTNQDDRLRLVPLVATLAEMENPQLYLSQVLDLALREQIRLYRPVPPGKVAYVDASLPVVTHRRSSLFFPPIGDFTRYDPKSAQIHPEVTHVALDPDHAKELKVEALRVSSDMAFASGLTRHPDDALALAGWLVPRQFGTSLVICPALPNTEKEERRQLVRRVYLTTTPEDIFVDERVFAVLAAPQGTEDNDPYTLCRRAPGVYALYFVAKHYHSAIKADRAKFVEAQKLIISLLSKLGETRAKQIAKLINPHHRRNSGVPEKLQKHFDIMLLDDEQFKARYRRENFVTDALALILFATENWLNSLTTTATGAPLIHDDRSKARPIFRRLGFYEKEVDALVELLLLPRVASRSQAWRKITSASDGP